MEGGRRSQYRSVGAGPGLEGYRGRISGTRYGGKYIRGLVGRRGQAGRSPLDQWPSKS